MTTQPHHPTTPRVATYNRTNRTGPDAERDLARQHRLCQAVAERLGGRIDHFYDIGAAAEYDAVKVSSIAVAGGPPGRDGGWAELTADLAGPNPTLDMIVVADYDRFPRQPNRREPLLAAIERARCRVISAARLSVLDRDADLEGRIAALVLHGIADAAQERDEPCPGARRVATRLARSGADERQGSIIGSFSAATGPVPGRGALHARPPQYGIHRT